MPVDDFPQSEELQSDTVKSEMPDGSRSNADTQRDEIARRAYRFWQARGCQDGSSEEDWSWAERDVRSERSVGETPKGPSREAITRETTTRVA